MHGVWVLYLLPWFFLVAGFMWLGKNVFHWW